MLAQAVTCALEKFGLRGAPTLLRYLGKLPMNRRQVGRVVLPSGRQIAFPAYDHYWCRYLWAGAAYEPDVEYALRLLGRARPLIDCGANIGYWSVRAPEFGYNRIVSVEANADLIPLLRANVEQVHGKVHHAAVHSSSGETLYLDTSRGHAPAALRELGNPVTSITLNELAHGLESPVIKLDVEGAEIAALEAADEIDADFIYEDWPGTGMQVTKFLLSQGFYIYGTMQGVQQLRTVDQALAFNKSTTQSYCPSNLTATKCPLTSTR